MNREFLSGQYLSWKGMYPAGRGSNAFYLKKIFTSIESITLNHRGIQDAYSDYQRS